MTDAALLLDVISGHDRRDSTSIPETLTPVSPTLENGVAKLRVGVIDELTNGAGVALEVRAAVLAAAAALEAAGATIESVSLPSTQFGLSAYYMIAPAEASSNLARYDGVRYGLRVEGENLAAMNERTRDAGFGPEVKRRIMLGTYALSAGYYDAYYGRAQRVRTLITRDFNRVYEGCDVLLSPTSPTTAFKLGDRTADPMTMYQSDVCTIPTNLAGHPAMSVPWGTGADSMPVGVQILAPALAEATMFRVARVVEDAAP